VGPPDRQRSLQLEESAQRLARKAQSAAVRRLLVERQSESGDRPFEVHARLAANASSRRERGVIHARLAQLCLQHLDVAHSLGREIVVSDRQLEQPPGSYRSRKRLFTIEGVVGV
jgi:hypothetical protein